MALALAICDTVELSKVKPSEPENKGVALWRVTSRDFAKKLNDLSSIWFCKARAAGAAAIARNSDEPGCQTRQDLASDITCR